MKENINYKCVLLLLIMIFPHISFSQYADTNLGHDGFMGAVKSAKITPYQVVLKDEQVTKGDSRGHNVRAYLISGNIKNVTDYAADGTVSRTMDYTYDQDENLVELLGKMGEMTFKRETYTYDKAGNLLETITYTGDGSIAKKVSTEYDKKNQLIKSSEYSTSFGELLLNKIDKMEYDKDGNKVREIALDAEGKKWGSGEWKYDKRGNEIEWVNLTESGEIKVRQTFHYTKKNVLTTRKTYDKDEKLTDEANLDKYGQPLTLIRYDDSGNISRKSGKRYDKYGNVTAELSYDPDGAESVNVEFKYSYDDKNNWIEQIIYQDGKAVYIMEREISYY